MRTSTIVMATPRCYAIVGGGIAAVSCAEQLSQLSPKSSVEVISGTPLIKAVTNFKQMGRSMEEFEVRERSAAYLTQLWPNVRVHNTPAVSFDHKIKVEEFVPRAKSALVVLYIISLMAVQLADGSCIHYDKLCICTGASPNVIAKDHPRVVGIRDTESVEEFQTILVDAKRVVVVGNGGIATELVYEMRGCEVVWAIKDASIGHTFFDEGAAAFFLPHLAVPHHSAESVQAEGKPATVPVKRMKYTLDSVATEKASSSGQDSLPCVRGHSTHNNSASQQTHPGSSSPSGKDTSLTSSASVWPESRGMGSALGPDWHVGFRMTGRNQTEYYRHVHVEYNCEVTSLLSPEQFRSRGLEAAAFPTKMEAESPPDLEGMPTAHWPLYVELTNGKVYGCDLVVSATGVVPNTSVFTNAELRLTEDGGIAVDPEMRSSIPGVYAAGDVCTIQWDPAPQMWFQMRLWTQARQMGAYAAKCMIAHEVNETITPDFCFELFAHVTKFFGYKVILLGRYNAQGLGRDYEILLRCTKGHEYIKVILQNGRMVGAILIGETDLEETFENLILNQMDLSRFGESLLDPNIDIEDYFD